MSLPGQHESQLTTIEACRACLDTKSSNFVQLNSECSSWREWYQFCVDLSYICNNPRANCKVYDPLPPGEKTITLFCYAPGDLWFRERRVSVDSGSQLLCHQCADLIRHYVEFKKQCHKSEEFWCSLLSDEVKCNANKINIKFENNEINFVESNALDIDSLKYYPGNDNDKNHEDADSFKEECVDRDRDVEVLEDNLFDHNDTFLSDIGLNVVRKKKTKGTKKKWQCENCQSEYKSKKSLLGHIKTCEDSNKIALSNNEVLYCGLCEFTSDRELMKQHLDGHALNNDMNCRNCDFVGKDFASMVSHRYSHQSPNMKPKMYCHLCNVTMRSSAVLQYHYRTVHLQKPGLDCTLCKKSFKTYKCWRNHDRWHRVDKYICDICGKKFLFKNAIEAHMADHADIKKYICETCGRGFKRLFNLKCHVSNRHTIHAPVKCSHCNRTFKSEFNLQSHLRLVNKEKPFSCPVCSKKFPSEVTLKNHLFWHSDERPFACEICGAKYKAKSQLKIHMRQHTGIMPFKCQHCDKSFASSNQLKVHSSVHTGIRRHKCNYCHRTFHGRKLVEAHCAAQHKEKELKLNVHI